MISNFSDAWPQFFDENGKPIIGRIKFFSADTSAASSTYKTVWQDPDFETEAPNPCLTDATGKTDVQIFVKGGLYYVVVERFLGSGYSQMSSYMDDASMWEQAKTFFISAQDGDGTSKSFTANTVAELRTLAVPSADGTSVLLTGYYVNGDTTPRILVWNASSTSADDGVSVFADANSTTGRWIWTAEPFIDSGCGGVFPNMAYAALTANMANLSAFCKRSASLVAQVRFRYGRYSLGIGTADFGDTDVWAENGATFGCSVDKGYTLKCGRLVAFPGAFNVSSGINLSVIVKRGEIASSWFHDYAHWSEGTPDRVILDADIAGAVAFSGCIVSCAGGQINASGGSFSQCRFRFSAGVPLFKNAVTTGSFKNCSDVALSNIAGTNYVYVSVIAASSGTRFLCDGPIIVDADYDDTANNRMRFVASAGITGTHTLTVRQADGFGKHSVSCTLKYGYHGTFPDTLDATVFSDSASAVNSATAMGCSAIDFGGETRTDMPDAPALTLIDGKLTNTASATALHLKDTDYTLALAASGCTINAEGGSVTQTCPWLHFGDIVLKDCAAAFINCHSTSTEDPYFIKGLTATDSSVLFSGMVYSDGDLAMKGSSLSVTSSASNEKADYICKGDASSIYLDACAVSLVYSGNSNGALSAKSITVKNGSSVKGHVGKTRAQGELVWYSVGGASVLYPEDECAEAALTCSSFSYTDEYAEIHAVSLSMKGCDADAFVYCGNADISGNRIGGDVHLQVMKGYDYTSCTDSDGTVEGSSVIAAQMPMTFQSCITGVVSGNRIGGLSRKTMPSNNSLSRLHGMLYIDGRPTNIDNPVNTYPAQGPGNPYCVIDLYATGNTFRGYQDLTVRGEAETVDGKDYVKAVPMNYDPVYPGSIISTGVFNYAPYPQFNRSNSVTRKEITSGSVYAYSYGRAATATSIGGSNKLTIKGNMGPIGCASTEGFVRMDGSVKFLDTTSPWLFRLCNDEWTTQNYEVLMYRNKGYDTSSDNYQFFAQASNSGIAEDQYHSAVYLDYAFVKAYSYGMMTGTSDNQFIGA